MSELTDLLMSTPLESNLKVEEDCLLMLFPTSEIEALRLENHVAVNKLFHFVAKVLARRLASTNEKIVAKTIIDRPVKKDDKPKISNNEPETLELDDDDLEVLDKLWS